VASRDAEIWAKWNTGGTTLADLGKAYDITPQRVGQVIAAKEGQIYGAWKTGRHTLADLAEQYGLTHDDISRILAARHPEQEDEKTSRAVMRSRLELLTLAVQDIIEHPGWKMAPNGRLAEDADGNPLPDTSAKIEAIKVQLLAFKNLEVLNGDAKPQRTHVTHELAQQQADTWLADMRAQREAELREMDALRRQAAAIPGEVVRELPVGGLAAGLSPPAARQLGPPLADQPFPPRPLLGARCGDGSSTSSGTPRSLASFSWTAPRIHAPRG
jgi:hypothetical protein